MSATTLDLRQPDTHEPTSGRSYPLSVSSDSLFGCIVADPPWPVRQPPRKWKTGTVNEPLAYPTMKVEEISALQVERLAGESCHLYLWTVNRFVRDAYDVAEAWGFTPSMLLTWAKTPMGIGPGRQYASTTEFALFAYRGPQAREPKRIERNWWNWPRGQHSAKPEAFQDIVEQVSPGPYLELFARRQRLGWSSWGNEVPCDVVLSSANVPDQTRANGPVIGLAVESWLADARMAIETARKFADKHEERIGWFVLRDLEATKRAGLSDLAWSGHQHGVTLGELRWFIEELERFLSANT